MTDQLEPLRPIDPHSLDSARYFESLLQEALSKGLLTAAQLEGIQCDCLALLTHQVERYTGGASSSIPVEKAQVLMTSLLFTLGLALKAYPSPESALRALQEESLAALFQKGRKRIQTMLSSTKTIYAKLTRHLIPCPNECYRSTVLGGIPGFFKLYDPDFAAQDIHITADYPVFPPLPPLEGIEFIRRYLDCLYYENQLCAAFPAEDIHRLLHNLNGDYEQQLFNLFEPVLLTALGCVLTGADPLRLTLTEADAAALHSLFASPSGEPAAPLLQAALEQLQALLDCPQSLKRYLQSTLPFLAAHLEAAARTQTLHLLFAPARASAHKPAISFSFGAKMEDRQYCRLIEEIDRCRYSSDKLAILHTHFQSLSDLSDALLDADWTADELAAIFAQLPFPAFAALVKRHSPLAGADETELSPQELLLQACLAHRIQALPPRQRELLLQVADALEEEPF